MCDGQKPSASPSPENAGCRGRYEIVYSAVDGEPEGGLISLKIMVGERGFEPPTPWSRTRSKRLLKSVEICCLQLIDTEPVASRSLKAVAIGRNERFSLSQICLHHVRIFNLPKRTFARRHIRPQCSHLFWCLL